MTEQEHYEQRKTEQTKKTIENIVTLLREIDTMNEDIKHEAKAIEEQFDTKASLVISMAKEKYGAKSTEAIRKNEEVVDNVKSLFGEGA